MPGAGVANERATRRHRVPLTDSGGRERKITDQPKLCYDDRTGSSDETGNEGSHRAQCVGT
jgi:hypothetical protein